MSRPRILLADDHALIAEGVSKLIESEFDLMGIVQDGRTLLEKIRKDSPDVLLLDISLPLLNGIEAAHRIKSTAPTVKIIFLTMHAEPSFIKDAESVGAWGYVLKQAAAHELIHAIHEALNGRPYFSSILKQTNKDSSASAPTHAKESSEEWVLTPRQREVVQLVAEGYSNKEIASILNLSLKTVEFHKSRIMRSIGAKRTAELTQYAITHRIVTP